MINIIKGRNNYLLPLPVGHLQLPEKNIQALNTFIIPLKILFKLLKVKKLFVIILISTTLLASSKVMAQGKRINIQIDAGSVTHQMKGGIGASWHALITDIPLENDKYEYPVKIGNYRGSAWAGNPPITDTVAWNQLYKHAKWLGLNFVRVELSMRMYEPERNAFDWKNDEMKSLYRILDWCQANHADVFLQQMWGHVEWNAYPGVHPLWSAPKSLDDFANGIATLLKNLTETHKYTCIKYFCMTNEPPGGGWGYWWGNGPGVASLTDAWKKLRETFDKEKIKIPISGPDWTSLPPFEASKIDFDQYIGSYDIHSYYGIYNQNEKIVTDWANWAHSHNKPFFLSEFGNMNLGWGVDNPGPKTFKAALSNALDVAVCMNLGVDGFNRWSFTNRGNIDGQWQLVQTFDPKTNTYTKNVTPENEAYYGFAMLTRFMGKYASVLSCNSNQKLKGVVSTAYKNRDGNISVLMINSGKDAVTIDISIDKINKKRAFYLYQVTEDIVKKPSFKLNPQKVFKDPGKLKSILLLPESISIVTTNGLKQEDFGVIE